MDVERFHIYSDEQMALDLLKQQKILVTAGSGFHWDGQDHFRIVYLPRIEVLSECMEKLADFLSVYRQR